MKNHYEILEVEPTASKEEIEKAYKFLSKQFHPDKNDGLAYFDELYLQIKEAHHVLSEEASRNAYDKANNLNQKEETEEVYQNKKPEILNFEADKETFEEGESIQLAWETKDADIVTLKPFGEVETSDSRTFRLKNFAKDHLIITLIAKNSINEVVVEKSITLQNKVTEFDFAKTEVTEEQNTTQANESQNEPEVQANSFTGTSIINSTSTFKEETFFSIRGRLRRSAYFGRSFLLALPIGIMLAVAENSYNSDLYGLFAIVFLVFGILILIQFVKRLHDINLSGWWALIHIIPYLGGIFGFIVFCIDGSKGPNEYGEDPKGRL